jgi:hypothetical protein
MIVYWAGWNTNWKLFAAIGIGLVLLAVYKAVAKDALAQMDWRAGAWVLPWLGALALVSYLGTFGSESANVLRLGAVAPIIFVLSVIVYLVAYKLRLPETRTREMVERGSAST